MNYDNFNLQDQMDICTVTLCIRILLYTLCMYTLYCESDIGAFVYSISPFVQKKT